MVSRTTYLARLIGAYSILIGLSMLLERQAATEMVGAVANNPGLMFVTGLVAVVVGLAIVLGHNVWSGGVLPVVITLIGCWSLTKGLACLFMPSLMAEFLRGPVYARISYFSPLLTVGAGLYLVYASRSSARWETE